MALPIGVVCEGDTDIPVVRKLLQEAGLEPSLLIDSGGKGRLDKRLPKYNQAAAGSPWFVLRDLDRDAACAPEFLRTQKLAFREWMCFRLAVREVESWLMADAESFAHYFGVSRRAIPVDPDAEERPTRVLVDLVRKSRKRGIVKAVVPIAGHSVGPLYESTIIDFAESRWSPERGSLRSASLRSARRALREIAARWGRYVNNRPGEEPPEKERGAT